MYRDELLEALVDQAKLKNEWVHGRPRKTENQWLHGMVGLFSDQMYELHVVWFI